MSTSISTESIIGFPVFITDEQYDEAYRQAKQHDAPAKQQRVLHHLLAVLAVENYCQNMGVVTTREGAYSFDRIEQTSNDVADLVLPGLGRLECRAVGDVSPLWSDGLGVVVVQWEESARIMRLLGFISHTELDPNKPITAVAPLDQLFEQIAKVELKNLQLESEDSVMSRVSEKLQGRSQTELVLMLERILREPSPRSREIKLTQFFLGLDDSDIVGTEYEFTVGAMLNTSESDRPRSEVEQECIELAEDLLDCFANWQEEIDLTTDKFVNPNTLRNNKSWQETIATPTFQVQPRLTHATSTSQYIDSCQNITETCQFKMMQAAKIESRTWLSFQELTISLTTSKVAMSQITLQSDLGLLPVVIRG